MLFCATKCDMTSCCGLLIISGTYGSSRFYGYNQLIEDSLQLLDEIIMNDCIYSRYVYTAMIVINS